ncbi:hypothetical protein AYO45_00135 [Gammaproteobacteria bacterium SCGC AG-212-F23]|nr:hypothetical protein AYO45_00135 [Gammaproteobacteria bacterium SCGC AG-212-F23]
MPIIKTDKRAYADKISELRVILQSVDKLPATITLRLNENINALKKASIGNTDYDLAKLAIYIEILRLAMPELQNNERLSTLYHQCEHSLRKLPKPQLEKLYADHFITYYTRLPGFDAQALQITAAKNASKKR